MDERDLIREATAALDDLGGLAPEPPTLSSITSGRAPLQRIEPARSRWRFAAALVGAAAVTVLVVGIAALIGSNLGDGTLDAPTGATEFTGGSINGTWVLVSYTYEGETRTAEAATVESQRRTPAWIEISDQRITGDTGCNGFNGAEPPQRNGDTLVFGEIIVSAGGCIGQTPEPALLEALWSGSEGVTLTMGDGTMTLTTNSGELTFEQRDRRPIPPPLQWSTTFDRLDCSPSVYLTEQLRGTGLTLDDTLRAVPGVTSVEEATPFGWGLDTTGKVIAGAAIGDIEPPTMERWTCADSNGLRSDADLGNISYSWANDLGLGQLSPIVWSQRFIELCSSDIPDLGSLAERYLQEDAATSLRADGTTPQIDQAIQTLDVMRRSACSTESTPTSTTVPTTSIDGLVTTTTGITPVAFPSCSAENMPVQDDYPPSYENLPAAAMRTRDMLMDAAMGCDFNAIVALARSGSDTDTNDAILWGAAGTRNGLIQNDLESGSMMLLATALTTLPSAAYDGERWDASTETWVPNIFYSWPPVHDDLGADVGLEDVWDAETLKRVAALNDQTVEEVIASANEVGGYIGFRVGIDEDGRWTFALAGD